MRMSRRSYFYALALPALALLGCGDSTSPTAAGPNEAETVGASGSSKNEDASEVELLNVSYDPTRELWREVNEKFTAAYEKDHNVRLSIKQSHGGSSSQARAVIDGLEADVVSLAMWPDTMAIAEKGLISADWENRLPNRSLPYTSTLVFVVRKGNPKGIKDWGDLIKGDVQVITPNPKTSGNGKLSFLAAWGHVLLNKGSEAEAREFVRELYKRVPVLDTGARGATTTFAQRGIGDAHITWENEAHLEVEESKGELEIVFPPRSILAEPHVALVDANVDRKKTREVAEAYLQFLFTPDGQEIIAKHYYRPFNEEVAAKHAASFPNIERFPLSVVAKDWNEALEKFFKDGGEFDQIYQPQAL